MEPCVAGEPVNGCCLLAVPNTSEWQVVCANNYQPNNVPMTSSVGTVILIAAIGAAAIASIVRSAK